MINLNTTTSRIVSVVTAAAVLNLALPYYAWSASNVAQSGPVKRIFSMKVPFTDEIIEIPFTEEVLVAEEVVRAKSRTLTTDEMKKMSGKMGDWNRCQYLAGQSKWDVVYKGVNMMTGNFSTAATDISFEGGFGIPVNVTRSYSAHDGDEGPFGIGWTLSVDVRTTAGGVLKSAGSPVRSVPVNYKMRHSGEEDPREKATFPPSKPIDAVIATDAQGTEEIIQIDVDGIMTTPAWDKNTNLPEFEIVEQNGKVYEVLKKNTLVTPEGTTYVYEKQGTVTGGGVNPYFTNMTNPDAEPSNVLKISTVTDRHGNTTTYTYDQTKNFTFSKESGTTSEHPIKHIAMPNGWHLIFNWNATTERITSVVADDNPSGTSSLARQVSYTYNSSGNLQTVSAPFTVGSSTPKLTTYGYGAVRVKHGGNPAAFGNTSDVLTTITDPRGLTTKINYVYDTMGLLPYSAGANEDFINAFRAYSLEHPNGTSTLFAQVCTDNVYPETATPAIALGTVSEHIGYWGSQYAVYHLGTTFSAGQSGAPDTVKVKENFVANGSTLEKVFVADSMNLISTLSEIKLTGSIWPTECTSYKTTSTTTYNFLGAPITKSIEEFRDAGNGMASYKEFKTEYAYHGASKYFQQKAIKDPAGRLTYTDYFDKNSSTGKGMTKEVYDTKYGAIAAPGNPADWRYNVGTTSSSIKAASFTYDDEGRATSVQKLQKVVSGTPTYVTTNTEYDASNGSPFYGNAKKVTEDYGGVGRITETISYDLAGRASKVKDASGKFFETQYNPEGQVLSVSWCATENGSYIPVATYTYGSSSQGTAHGMVTKVEDHLSSIAQTITYKPAQTGTPPTTFIEESPWGGVGQVEAIVENRYVAGSSTNLRYSYNTAYRYNSSGDRSLSIYDTPNGQAAWRYFRYGNYGFISNPARVFGSVNKQQFHGTVNGYPVWKNTTEEFSYLYDDAGRLVESIFAQTPDDTYNGANYGPEIEGVKLGEYYTDDNPSMRRAHVVYENDAAGRSLGVHYKWKTRVTGQSWNGNWTSNNILRNKSVYSGALHLKSETKYAQGIGSDWDDERTETYSYETERDFLTQTVYEDDTHILRTDTWTYDAAGNRASSSGNTNWTYDNLNRMSVSPKSGGGTHTYYHDILGNRTSRDYVPGQLGQPADTSRLYSWDILNRMTATAGTTAGARYLYRADGMRAEKIADITLDWVENPNAEDGSGFYDPVYSTNKPTTRYFYDGQMAIEEDLTDEVGYSVETHVKKYGIGARGIDSIDFWQESTYYGIQFPLYDGHGNMIATLHRNGTTYGTANKRYFDVWGSVDYEANVQPINPSQRYCANLGHVEDDESDLIYMRARYYEPWTGRFINEDPERDGENWYVYTSNQPADKVDKSGRAANWSNAMIYGWFIFFVASYLKGAETKDWKRFGMALAIMGGVTVLHEKGYMQTAVKRFALWAHTMFFRDSGPNIYGESPYIMRSHVVQAFYIGYALSLLFLAAMLDDWVSE